MTFYNWGFHCGNPNLDARKIHHWINKGNWDYGPGLYVTQNYDKLMRYKKGNRATWLVILENNAIKSSFVKISQEKFLDLKTSYKSLLKSVQWFDGITAENLLIRIVNQEDDKTTRKAKSILDMMLSIGVNFDGDFKDVACIFTQQVYLRKIGSEKFWTKEWKIENGLFVDM